MKVLFTFKNGCLQLCDRRQPSCIVVQCRSVLYNSIEGVINDFKIPKYKRGYYD